MKTIEELLGEKQRSVMERVLAEEEARRTHLVVAISGAHAYGFPSPDSDLDLKAIHVDPTARILGLNPPAPHADRMQVIDGVEIDYTSNEIKSVLLGILQGNGNYLERVLGHLHPLASPELDELRPLVLASLSRRLHRHYLGFATSQLKAFEAETPGSAKKLLYVLRTALTGAHALRTGRVVTDLEELVDEHGFADARELILAKRAGEMSKLPPELSAHWKDRVKAAFAALDEALHGSCLPVDPQGADAIEAWLLEQRARFT